ncbi:MAG: hypothetical protein AAF501_17860, partial [Pseudomonadota bacterium]
MMPTRLALCGLILVSFLGFPASALDLGEARQSGRVVADALEVGSGGDWARAEAMVAGQDPVVR